MKTSRRDLWRVTVGLTSVQWLRAQDAQRKEAAAKANRVVLRVAVIDKHRYINGLKLSDFRVWEDGILQKISAFEQPPSLLKQMPAGGDDPPETFESIRYDLENSYTITYY